MHILDTFDPGNQTGVARFENARLVYSDVLRFEALIRMPPMWETTPLGYQHETVIEIPKVYRVEHQKGDQEDIVGLAIKAGRIAERHGSRTGFLGVEPRTWKGQRPKKVTKNRAKEVLGPFELCLIK